ncbi:MAG TPA: hypothetical protein VIG90_01080 [Pedomonas sp.]|uniref:hypothetical protein n=1 Tax=Pedomonas sp. TaxID=2976421 RepID=UPI002F3FBF99
MPRNQPFSPLLVDTGNPEWTREDFKRAVRTGGVPLDEALKRFRRARSQARPEKL